VSSACARARGAHARALLASTHPSDAAAAERVQRAASTLGQRRAPVRTALRARRACVGPPRLRGATSRHAADHRNRRQ